MRYLLLLSISMCLLFSCTTKSNEDSKIEFQNKGHELVYNMVQKTGSPEDFFGKKDVEYTYTYTRPDGKHDISTERYLFDGELSYGKYEHHERTFSDLEGTIEQGFDGEQFWLKQNGEMINDEDRIKRVSFSRPTNYYWFTMWPKLLDPGLTYEHKGEKTFGETTYDIVDVSFTNDDKAKDIYQLHINQETGLVDQFLFTVAEVGRVEQPLLMKVEHIEIDGLMIPAKRKYKGSTWDADVDDNPWIDVVWSNIQFNTGMTKEDFRP